MCEGAGSHVFDEESQSVRVWGDQSHAERVLLQPGHSGQREEIILARGQGGASAGPVYHQQRPTWRPQGWVVTPAGGEMTTWTPPKK